MALGFGTDIRASPSMFVEDTYEFRPFQLHQDSNPEPWRYLPPDYQQVVFDSFEILNLSFIYTINFTTDFPVFYLQHTLPFFPSSQR